jgi:hypothetical protein
VDDDVVENSDADAADADADAYHDNNSKCVVSTEERTTRGRVS